MKVKDSFQKIYKSNLYLKESCERLLDFPPILDIEITNACNLSCVMCARNVMKRKVGYMDLSLFKEVLRQAGKSKLCRAIRFNGQGEPFLHKDFFKMIKLAKEKGFKVHVTSNGMLLNKERIEKFLLTGADKIKFSFQGTGKDEFEKMRRGADYGLLLQNIKYLIERRKALGLDRPFVQVATTILDEGKEDAENFIAGWLKVVDGAYYGYTATSRVKNTPQYDELKKRDISKKRSAPCMEVRTKMTVLWNGDVSACCTDYDGKLFIGNMAKESLEEIWLGEKASGIRDVLEKNDKSNLPVCRECYSMF